MKDIDPLFDEEIEPIEPKDPAEASGKKRGRKKKLMHRKRRLVPQITRPALNKAIHEFLDNGGVIRKIETEFDDGWFSILN